MQLHISNDWVDIPAGLFGNAYDKVTQSTFVTDSQMINGSGVLQTAWQSTVDTVDPYGWALVSFESTLWADYPEKRETILTNIKTYRPDLKICTYSLQFADFAYDQPDQSDWQETKRLNKIAYDSLGSNPASLVDAIGWEGYDNGFKYNDADHDEWILGLWEASKEDADRLGRNDGIPPMPVIRAQSPVNPDGTILTASLWAYLLQAINDPKHTKGCYWWGNWVDVDKSPTGGSQSLPPNSIIERLNIDNAPDVYEKVAGGIELNSVLDYPYPSAAYTALAASLDLAVVSADNWRVIYSTPGISDRFTDILELPQASDAIVIPDYVYQGSVVPASNSLTIVDGDSNIAVEAKSSTVTINSISNTLEV